MSVPDRFEAPRAEPVRGPACWYAPELEERRDEWHHVLAAAEVAELDGALDRLAGRESGTVTRAEVGEAGALCARLARVRDAVVDGPGVAVLRGIPVERYDADRAALALWILALLLGRPIPQDGAGTLVHHIRDEGVSIEGRDDTRVYQTNRAQTFHNDGGDVFALLCRRPAAEGGESYVASAWTVFNEVLARRPDLARVLQEPFCFDARGQQLPGEGPVQRLPVFTFHRDRLFFVYKRPYIDLAQRFPDVPRLTRQQIEALDLVDALCEDPRVRHAFTLRPGDVEIASNHTVLHGRAAFRDAPSPDGTHRGRHLLRVWLAIERGWPLPPVFRHSREFGPLFSVPGRAA